MKTKALTFSVKMPSLVGDGSSCSQMHLVGFNGGAIDDPPNGYGAQAANFLVPSCLCLPVLSGSTLLMRNRLRAIMASKVKHPFDLKKSEMNGHFQDGLNEPSLTALGNDGAAQGNETSFYSFDHTCTRKRKKIMCTIRTYEYKGSLNLKVEPIVNLTGISA